MFHKYAAVSAVVMTALGAATPELRAQAANKKPVASITGDISYVSATGNTRLTTLSIGEKFEYADGPWTFSQLVAYVYGETKGLPSANQLRTAVRADYGLRPRVSLFTGVAFERNTFAGFRSRFDEIGGVRWKAVVETWDTLSVDGGGQLTQEEDVSGVKKNYPSARVAGDYKHAFSKDAYFRQLAEYVPNLETSGAYRVNTESSLVAPLSAHVSIKLNYSVRYDSRPPVKFGTTDRTLTTGVQVSF